MSKKAREYHIEFLGGLASLGIFTQFTEEHIASFDVIAHSEEEAIKYIDEWCVFADKENRSLLHCSHAPVTDKEIRNCGVIRAYPFRLDDSEDEIYSELGDLPPSDFEGGECSNRFH
ncbi:MAG: hypothetical protein IT290_03040 [Deltaproteobacteria bacterium]|nr:hypothetical protein [Deltaproteobacteria bacterium]